MSQLETFLQQLKVFLGIPDIPVPLRIEREEEHLRDLDRDYDHRYGHARRPHR